ncbi:aspartate-semialdehyde dehydrogenase [Trifolium repens]|nr:aspartate-semialdehyde dehydrogenase [Trifolium repens]
MFFHIVKVKLSARIQVLEGKPPTCNIFSRQYAFNLFSHNAPVLSNGYNEEEMKLVKETRKIWNDKDVKVTATCYTGSR